MTNISSLVNSVIVSNSLVTYATIKIIPLKTIEHCYSQFYHVTDCIFTCYHGRYYYKIENIWASNLHVMYTCCYKRYL